MPRKKQVKPIPPLPASEPPLASLRVGSMTIAIRVLRGRLFLGSDKDGAFLHSVFSTEAQPSAAGPPKESQICVDLDGGVMTVSDRATNGALGAAVIYAMTEMAKQQQGR